ncbi:MAG: hypothetical protein IK093_17490 [Ruminiclostridium sp.]|nr:hypothetical protein [Ruminiclostridium sp.]
MSFNTHDIGRDAFMLNGGLGFEGYDWWWHSFTGVNDRTGKEKSFFVEFFTCNPVLGGDEPVLGQTEENKRLRRKPSYMMVKAGCWGEGKCQLHRFFPWNKVRITNSVPFMMSIADCVVSETILRGSVEVTPEQSEDPGYMCDCGTMEWSLRMDKQIPFNVGYGAGKMFRSMEAFEMYWHAEGMKTLYTGYVMLNGERYTVTPETSYGYADKNWGKNFTSPWIWLSSWDLMSLRTGKRLENSVFDIGGGCPKVYFMPLKRKLLGAFMYEGTPYEFNFSKPWTGAKTVFRTKETEREVFWYVVLENNEAVMTVRVRCPKTDMLLANYEAPDGSKRHNRLWNGGTGLGLIRLYSKSAGGKRTLIDEIQAVHIGCEYGEFGEADSDK